MVVISIIIKVSTLFTHDVIRYKYSGLKIEGNKREKTEERCVALRFLFYSPCLTPFKNTPNQEAS